LSPARQTIFLFLAIGCVLVIATAIGMVLDRRRGGMPDPMVDNLNQRIRAWWLMVVLIGIAFVFGRIGVIVLFAIASFTALREFITLTETRRGDHYALVAAFFVILPLQYILIAVDWYGLYSIFIPVYAFLFMPIIAAIRAETTRFMERVAVTQWALMLAVFCVSHVPALLTLRIPGYEGRGLLLIAFLVIVVQSSDVMQYVWGKLFGHYKIAPTLSPSKTWEGFLGGIGSASLIGLALFWITPFSPPAALLMAFVAALMGFFGGLVMSAIKRDRGVKDWGAMIEGHGGMLDRLDSVIFAAPIFFHLTRYFWAV
jgi:phosphatidate cytidylyltransferase